MATTQPIAVYDPLPVAELSRDEYLEVVRRAHARVQAIAEMRSQASTERARAVAAAYHLGKLSYGELSRALGVSRKYVIDLVRAGVSADADSAS